MEVEVYRDGNNARGRDDINNCVDMMGKGNFVAATAAISQREHTRHYCFVAFICFSYLAKITETSVCLRATKSLDSFEDHPVGL